MSELIITVQIREGHTITQTATRTMPYRRGTALYQIANEAVACVKAAVTEAVEKDRFGGKHG